MGFAGGHPVAGLRSVATVTAGAGFQVSGVRCWVSGAGFQVLGVRCWVSGIRCQVSGVRCQVLRVRCRVSGVGFKVFRRSVRECPCENSTLSPLGERVARGGAFTSRRGTGLRPPKAYGRSGRTVRYGPQAGEGVSWAVIRGRRAVPLQTDHRLRTTDDGRRTSSIYALVG
jgi:hypothetical protein